MILVSTNKDDIKTHFNGEATNKCMSNSNRRRRKPHYSKMCFSPKPGTLFDTRKCTGVAAQDPPTCLFAHASFDKS